MKDDDQPTADEQREAEALAAALAGEPAAAPPPAALETAALLRYAHGPGGDLDPARQAAIANRVRPALAAGRRRPRRWWPWLFAPALAAASMSVLVMRGSAPRQAVSVAPPAIFMPPPVPAKLLAAQAQAARGKTTAPAALAALDGEMRAYRRALYTQLGAGGDQ